MSALCACGRLASHLNAREDSPEWACRVPDFDPQTGRIDGPGPCCEAQRDLGDAYPLLHDSDCLNSDGAPLLQEEVTAPADRCDGAGCVHSIGYCGAGDWD